MIVAGFGFREAAQVASLQDALENARGAFEVDGLATLTDKAEHPAFRAFAQAQGAEVFTVSEASCAAAHTTTQSAAARLARRTGSVAEATALVAAGPGATLITQRFVSADRMATCALAQSTQKEGQT